MSNLTQSTQSTATVAPDYYTNYLSNLANTGTTAAQNAQYVGAQPLQQQAFQDVTGAATAYQPTLTAAGNTLNAATSATSPLAAASPYLNQATTNPAAEANQYLSSYLMPAAQSLSDINQNNINMNLNPSIKAAATGSGQFGSSRANQAIGQADVLANQQTNSAIANLLNTGYQNALTSAIQQNQVANQAGTTAASAAGTGQSNLTAAGQAQGNLAAQNQNLGLAGINAESTLGQQQQTIAQNQQLFPLTTLSTLASLMSGQQVPTTTNTTLNTSPLSTLAALGSSAAGISQLGTGASNLVNTGITGLTKLLNGNGGTANLGTTGQTSSGDSTGTMDYSGGVTVMPDPTSSTGWSVNGTPTDENGNVVSGGDFLNNPLG